MYDYSVLPPHIITDVLSHLNISDFYNAVCTCKSWYHASCDPRIARNLRVSAAFDATTIDFLSRPITHLRLTNLDMKHFKYRDLLWRFGHTIVELDLFVKLPMTRLFEMFIYLPNIVTLKFFDNSKFVSPDNFYRCRKIVKHNERIRKNLANIRSLTIQMSVRDLQLYKVLLKCCTNLQQFSWYGFGLRRIEHSVFLTDYLLNPNEIQILENVSDLLVRSIDKEHNSRFFEQISHLKLPNVKKLNLSEISVTYYDTMFKEFCRTYNTIESLTICGCNDLQLTDICTYMTKLKVLEIGNCIVGNSLILIKNLEYLECLLLERRSRIMDVGLIVLMSLKLNKLKSLCLSNITSDLLLAICDNCPDLEKLTLIDIDTKDCEPIFRNLHKLQKLHLAFTEKGKYHWSKIISSPEWNITKLKNLDHLWVSCFVPGITPELIKQMPKLKARCQSTVYDSPNEQQSDINYEEVYDDDVDDDMLTDTEDDFENVEWDNIESFSWIFDNN